MAIQASCRCPPESSPNKRSASRFIPVMSSAASICWSSSLDIAPKIPWQGEASVGDQFANREPGRGLGTLQEDRQLPGDLLVEQGVNRLAVEIEDATSEAVDLWANLE